MATVRLRAMTSDEYQAYLDQRVPEYGADKARSGEFDPETANERARQEFDALLPDGRDTPGHLIFTADSADGEPVGGLWLALPSDARRMAWVFDIWVSVGQQGRGYGRAIMLAGESQLRARDVTELGLNVFGDNPTAIHLYDSLGFRVTAQQMSKSL